MRVADLRAQHAEEVTASLLLEEYPAENKKALIQYGGFSLCEVWKKVAAQRLP